MNSIPESDWKYLRANAAAMLETFCKRANDEAARLVTSPALSQHEKFLRLFQHVLESNEIIARCFDDWRRSNILLKALSLRQEQLLTDEHLAHLSEETRSKIDMV